MESWPIFERLGIALLLGLLVGLQREYADSGLAGVRTFPLITVLGSLCALCAQVFGGWVIAAGLVGLAMLVAMANYVRRDEHEGGITTEIATLVMFAVGAYLAFGLREVAVAIGGGTAVLLHMKPQLHEFTHRLGSGDVRAIMQFALISCVILPVLPNQDYGPFGVFNPFNTWLMVVLIVGISLAGYLVYKFLGPRAGTFLGGILGGLISSTATTVSYARIAKAQPGLIPAAAVVIQIASAVVYVRVLLEIAAINRPLLAVALGPVLLMASVTVLPAVVCWLWMRGGTSEMPEQQNPSELKSALAFGALYVGVLFALAAAKHWFGGEGLYVVAALSGLTDMDAITVSSARMVSQERLDSADAWRLIVVASIANLGFKALMVAILAPRKLLALLVAMFAVPAATGALLVLFWPDHWTTELIWPQPR